MPKNKIESRRSLAQLLGDRMLHSYESLKDEKRLEADGSLVKTYLLEAHLSEDAPASDVLETLQDATRLAATAKSDTVVRETDEKLFFQVSDPSRGRPVTLYIDASNTRFWLAHSTSQSVDLDKTIARLTTSPYVDRAWLFTQFLERTSDRGSFRGLGLDYDRRQIPDVDLNASNAPVGFLKMQLWHSRADEILRVLRENFPSATALSKVKVKYWDPDNPDAFCLDDVKFNGKITARGTSFDTHITFVSDLYREYASVVRRLEDTQRIEWKTSGKKLILEGAPVNFVFGTRVSNLERFCELVFSSSPPFRLWGVPVRVADDYFRVSAVDLHVGSQLDFEVTPEYVRMYFGGHTCGNSVLRFFTNLQHHYDARVEVLDGNGQSLI